MLSIPLSFVSDERAEIRYYGYQIVFFQCGNDGFAERSSKADKQIEREADCLGAFLLMPKGAVKIAFHRLMLPAEQKVIALSDQFNVSQTAMKIRLKEMGLLT